MNPMFYEKTKDGEALYDIYARLVKERVIFLAEEIDPETSSIVAGLLFLLDQEDSEEPISLWIHSPGGDVQAFFAIYDMMQLIRAPVKTICIGEANSAAAILLAAGSAGMRYATANAHVMVHQVSVEGVGGTGTEVEIEAREVKKLKSRLTEILARHTGHSVGKIRRDCEHDRYMDAEAAKEYGIIDHILGPNKPIPELKGRGRKSIAAPNGSSERPRKAPKDSDK
jgi:ATP-dependent Clp protease, protease subunit